MAFSESTASTYAKIESPKKTIQVPATGGELWQGYVGGRVVMVNSPINYYGQISATVTTHAGIIEGADDSPLIRSAAMAAMEELQTTSGIKIEIGCSVPRGLGMASSTTEISAAAFATARALGASESQSRTLAHKIVNRLDSGNDSNYVRGLHLVAPREGQRLLSFVQVPALKMFIVNTGGSLATHAMDREREKEIGLKISTRIETSLNEMIRGLTFSNLPLIGQAATESTLVYQQITPKPRLKEVLKIIAREPELLGVASGHSGTVLCLLARTFEPFEDVRNELADLYGPENLIGQFSLVSGGFHELSGL